MMALAEMRTGQGAAGSWWLHTWAIPGTFLRRKTLFAVWVLALVLCVNSLCIVSVIHWPSGSAANCVHPALKNTTELRPH
jgi:hypothetical protein